MIFNDFKETYLIINPLIIYYYSPPHSFFPTLFLFSNNRSGHWSEHFLLVSGRHVLEQLLLELFVLLGPLFQFVFDFLRELFQRYLFGVSVFLEEEHWVRQRVMWILLPVLFSSNIVYSSL